MSSIPASEEATLDLTVTMDDLVEDKGARKWRAKQSLNINQARRQETKRMQEDKAAEERTRKRAAKKEEVRAKAAAAGPPLQIWFGFVSKDSSETYTMSNPDTKILGWGKSVQFFVHREVLIACSCYFEDVLLEGSSSDGSIATKKFAEEPLTLSLIIKFCYTQQYDICSDFDGRILNSTFLPTAEKYNMCALADLAFEAFEDELSSVMVGGWEAETTHYRWMARTLLATLQHSAAGKTQVGGRLREYIIEIWKQDDCKLARCYTTETDFYGLLLAAPEVLHEFWYLRPAAEHEYQNLRKEKKDGRCDDEVVAFFWPIGLHTPVE